MEEDTKFTIKWCTIVYLIGLVLGSILSRFDLEFIMAYTILVMCVVVLMVVVGEISYRHNYGKWTWSK